MNPLDDIQLPYTVEELVKTLDKVFPEKSADLKDSERTVWFKAGQRSVVNWLIELNRLWKTNIRLDCPYLSPYIMNNLVHSFHKLMRY